MPETPFQTPRSPLRSLEIIVVDDDPALRTILSTGLTHFGHRVRAAADGSEMDTLLAAAPAHAIILDVGLPGESGYEIAARLRSHWQGGIIMATAWGEVEQRVRGRESGADIYLVKPVDLRELASAVDSVARRLPVPASCVWRLNVALSILYTPTGDAIALTAHECLLLGPLLEQPGENIARAILFQVLDYPDSRHGDLRLETLVSRLRAKVRKTAPHTPLPLRGRTNLGYAFLATPSGD